MVLGSHSHRQSDTYIVGVSLSQPAQHTGYGGQYKRRAVLFRQRLAATTVFSCHVPNCSKAPIPIQGECAWQLSVWSIGTRRSHGDGRDRPDISFSFIRTHFSRAATFTFVAHTILEPGPPLGTHTAGLSFMNEGGGDKGDENKKGNSRTTVWCGAFFSLILINYMTPITLVYNLLYQPCRNVNTNRLQQQPL